MATPAPRRNRTRWLLVASLGLNLVAAGVIGGAIIKGPPPPDPGTLRKVKLVYRCSLCGTEVRMTAALEENPEPPRHCMEDMDLITPQE